MANEIAKKEEAGLPAEIMDDIMATSGEGVEYDTTELEIPYIRLAQGTSPQLKKSDAKYLPESEIKNRS